MGYYLKKNIKVSHSLYKILFKCLKFQNNISESIKILEDTLGAYFYNLGVRKLFLSRKCQGKDSLLGPFFSKLKCLHRQKRLFIPQKQGWNHTGWVGVCVELQY